MKKSTRTVFAILALIGAAFSHLNAQQAGSDVIMQGFYWNTHPGDISTNQGVWWDTLATVATLLKNAGFQTVWVPPPSKGFAGNQDMGYGIYDYFDLGEFNQKGTVRTRHGNKNQLMNMISTLHAAGLKIMVDVVLNHRGGGDGQELEDCDDGDGKQLRYTQFSPQSSRFPANAPGFHPNSFSGHCNLDPPYHERIFFEDICYFNGLDQILLSGEPNNGWFFGPHNMGFMGDSLIVWGRWLIDDLGFDEVRLDAVKHIEPGFLAPFLVELFNGAQPFAVGEYFDANMAAVKGYHDEVETFVSTYGTGSKDANLAMFDFNLRYALRDFCNNTSGTFDMWSLNTRGLRFNPGGAMDAEDIVTFVENHDTDRIGYKVVSCDGTEDEQYGSTCLKIFTDSGHDPVVTDKHLAYAYIMAAEGRPSVFWKDWFWYKLNDEIKWLMALRRATATGASTPIQNLNPYFPPGNSGQDIFVLSRSGSGTGKDGLVLAINDHATNTMEVWVNTPFTDMELKDYADAFMFSSTRAYSDSRALMRALARGFSWYAPTGLYPQPPDEPASHFALGNHVGAKLHYIALRASDASQFIVNGAPIEVGDEIAILHTSGNTAVGLARIGQSFRWDGVHDMIIEVLGGDNSGEAKGGLLTGNTLRLAVYDASAGQMIIAGSVTYAPAGTNFNFTPQRPDSWNGSGTLSLTTNNDNGKYQVGGVSLITAFEANPVLVQAKVMLEGPFDAGTQLMKTSLLDQGLLPTTAPYAEDPRTVSSIPADIVDWVLVQLRQTSSGPAVASRSAFLRKDGHIVDDDGVTTSIPLPAEAGNYYIVIRHRNHLSVMSASAVSLSSSTSTLYDFTSGQSQAYGTDPMKALTGGIYALYAGDANGDGLIDASDRSAVWRPQNGSPWAYSKYADFNCDGGIDAVDLNEYWRKNMGKSSQVP